MIDNITTTTDRFNILYYRVSTKTQEHNTSLEYQKKNLEQFCKNNSVLNYIHIFDVDSGSKTRPGIIQIKSLIELGLVDTIYLTKLDRLYRSIVKGSSFIQYCLDKNVNIKTSLETTDTSTATGMLQINLMMSIADYERKCIKNRTWTGKVSTFKNGYRSHGNIPFAYSKNDKSLDIVDEEAEVVRCIFSTYTKLKSLGKVKNELDTNGYLTRNSKSFGRKSIYNILTNDFYVGNIRLQNDVSRGNHTPIVSKNIFTRANKILHTNKKG